MIANDDVRSITWPVVPVFPAPPAASGNIITSQWHNQLNQAAKDIWTDLQALNAAVIPAPVATVFGRTGAVVAVAGDYTAAMVTNAVSTLGSYANPAWITSLAWGKLSGAPATFPPTAHVHSAADVTTGIFAAARLGSGTPDGTVYLRGDGSWQPLPPLAPHVHAAADITSGVMAPARLGTGTANAGVFLRGDGVWAAPPGGAGGGQTPWLSDIDGNGFRLYSASHIGIGNNLATMPAAVTGPHLVVGPTAADGTAGRIALCANAPAGTSVGALAYANYAIAGAEKRICQINGFSDGAINSGGFIFFTWNAGVNAERMRMTAAGDLGIGVSTPVTRLHVAADALRQLYLTGASEPTNKQMRLGYDASNNTCVVEGFLNGAGVNLLLNPAGGNVGIATSNIGARLQIQTDVLGATCMACSGGAPNFYLAAVAGPPNPGSNAAQTDAVLFAMATAAGHYALNQGDLIIATQTRVGTAGGNRIIFAHPADSFGGYTPGFYYDRGTVGIGGVPIGGNKLSVNGGRTLLTSAYDRYTLALKYSFDGPLTYIGSDLNGDCIFSNSGGSEVARITATGHFGIGTQTPKSRVHTFGLGQAGGTFETVNPAGGVFREMIYVQQGDGVAGSGGGVLFGWASGPFAAIKAYVEDGGGNSTGQMRFYTRAASADTFLTCRFYIGALGSQFFGDLSVAGTVYATGNFIASGILGSSGALRTGVIGSSDYAISRNGSDGYLYTDGLQAGFTGYIWRVDAASATREVLRIGNDGNVVIGPKSLASTQLLTLRKDGIAAFPAQGTPTQSGGFFRIQTYDVGCDFGIYPNGDCWIQPYNGITNLTQPYALTLCPLTGTKLGLLKVPGVSPLSIGQLPTSASGLAAGDVYRDGSGFLKIV